MNICVVGLGNIGFNLLTHLSTKFPSVCGIDIDPTRSADLQTRGYRVTASYQELGAIDIWILTPSTGPNAEQLFAALNEMAITPGSLISIESTLPPGTMYQIKHHLTARGFEIGKNLYLIHVPHRVMFGRDRTVCDTPRVMGAFTPACLEKGREFYNPLVPQLVETLDVRLAELSKIVENSLRFVNIAFAQEIYRYCIASGIAFNELRQAVNSKENVELLTVDWGIGGECLRKDIGFLLKSFFSLLLSGAIEADSVYRNQIISNIGKGKKVLVKGISYKPGIKCLNYSMGLKLVKALEGIGNEVWVDDPELSPEELAKAGVKAYKNEADHVFPDIVLDRHAPLENAGRLDKGADENGADSNHRQQRNSGQPTAGRAANPRS